MKKTSFPHSLLIMMAFIAIAAILTWIIPAGNYERVLNTESGREVVVPGSYQQTEAQPANFFDVFVAIPLGFISGADVIALVFIIGGAFYVIDKTGALQAGLSWLIGRFKNAKTGVLIIVGLLFATAGALNNLQEEIIALVPVVLIMTNRLRFSPLVAVGISAGCAAVGASFSPINPFQVGIAQRIADVPLLSGSTYRMIFLFIAVGFWLYWVLRYGKRTEQSDHPEEVPHQTISTRHAIILNLVWITFTVMVYGIIKFEWGFNEMSGLFFLTGLVSGFVGQLGINGTAKAYVEGFREMAFAAIIIGLARGIYVVLEQGNIIDSIVHGIFTPLQELPLALSAGGMMVAHMLIHIPVTSVSGQAVLTMPLLTPLADLIGLSRQVVILAYQYGAGITDIITPSNGALMAILAAAGVSYKDWFSFIWKPLIILFLIALVSIVIAILIHL